ncbi:hypothetical protein ACH4Q6_28475 [Streptomyces lydicus]|uniref:hypothetical protein n=1 Tax=Streptomyces lydicus TaxID=47763 RepID=UPI0037A08B83
MDSTGGGSKVSGWATAAQVATTFGTTIGLGSLGSGYYIFRKGRMDRYASEFRANLSEAISGFESLNDLITYEMANEVAATAVYARDLEPFFEDAQKALSLPEQDFDEFVKHCFDESPIIVAIHTRLTQTCEQILSHIEPSMTRYQTDFPGAYRLTRTASTIFARILREHKRIARKEKIWQGILRYLRAKDALRDGDTDRLRAAFSGYLAMAIARSEEAAEDDIDDILEMLRIVGTAYMGCSDKRVLKNRAEQGRVRMRPWPEIPTFTEELYEDEKALRALLESDKGAESEPFLEFHRRVARFEARRKEN